MSGVLVSNDLGSEPRTRKLARLIGVHWSLAQGLPVALWQYASQRPDIRDDGAEITAAQVGIALNIARTDYIDKYVTRFVHSGFLEPSLDGKTFSLLNTSIVPKGEHMDWSAYNRAAMVEPPEWSGRCVHGIWQFEGDDRRLVKGELNDSLSDIKDDLKDGLNGVKGMLNGGYRGLKPLQLLESDFHGTGTCLNPNSLTTTTPTFKKFPLGDGYHWAEHDEAVKIALKYAVDHDVKNFEGLVTAIMHNPQKTVPAKAEDPKLAKKISSLRIYALCSFENGERHWIDDVRKYKDAAELDDNKLFDFWDFASSHLHHNGLSSSEEDEIKRIEAMSFEDFLKIVNK